MQRKTSKGKERRAIITVDVGDAILAAIDECERLLKERPDVERDYARRRMTRSKVVRVGVAVLHLILLGRTDDAMKFLKRN